jgi:hypothetical protein
VEHPFWIIKCQFGFRKVFNRGIRKNDLKLKLLFASKMQHPAEQQNHYPL